MKILIFILLSYLFFNPQPSDFYFSINGIVNYNNHDTSSILGSKCYIFQNSHFIKSDSIINIKHELFEGTGELKYSILKKTELNLFKRPPSLLVIYIDEISIKDSINLSWDYKSENITSTKEFLLKNKNILWEQGYVFQEIDTSLTNKDLLKIINDRYEMKSAKINKKLIIICGSDIYENGQDTFTVIINNDHINFMKHTKFEQLIEINSEYYILTKGFKPSTGIEIYSITKIGIKGIENVFNDGSLST